jgi:hypothetical protein
MREIALLAKHKTRSIVAIMTPFHPVSMQIN